MARAKKDDIDSMFEKMTIEQAKTSAENAKQKIKEKSERGNEVIMSSSLSSNENSNELFMNEVKIPVIAPKPMIKKVERIKFNNYIKKDLVDRLDSFREEVNMSRSAILEEILENYLKALGK
ncbi:CopG family transcriptional regulator [Clostridium sp. WILCCON 0269]|uniref:CopG family transcriptional regulator n=1 Tax=Candidatus Clostridium eludens TaxID=3381663 RepID=A0ABW8SUW5_9CLOT